MLTKLEEYSAKTEEKVKAMKSKIKENVLRTNSDGTQINGLEQKEEINIQPDQKEETRIQKKRGEAEEPPGQL